MSSSPLTFQEKIALAVNLLTGIVVLFIIPFNESFLMRLPTILGFIIICYFSFHYVAKIARNNHSFNKFFIILIWCIFITSICIFIFMAIAEIFPPPAYAENSGYSTLGEIIDSILALGAITIIGLILTSPIWGSLTIINFLLLLKHPRGNK